MLLNFNVHIATGVSNIARRNLNPLTLERILGKSYIATKLRPIGKKKKCLALTSLCQCRFFPSTN